MTKEKVTFARQRLQTPRAAAIAGILFALLYGASLVLIRISIPSSLANDTSWIETSARTVSLALNLLPYAGICFLWFIGVIRDRMGELEDRFFSTVFLGSGLLFLALTFVSGALAGGLLNTYSLLSESVIESGVFAYSRAVMYQMLNIYGIRMAGVFMISLATIWIRTGLMHRGFAILTYILALVLLLSVGFSLWVTLIFPVWVMLISVTFLILNQRNRPEDTGQAV